MKSSPKGILGLKKGRVAVGSFFHTSSTNLVVSHLQHSEKSVFPANTTPPYWTVNVFLHYSFRSEGSYILDFYAARMTAYCV